MRCGRIAMGLVVSLSVASAPTNGAAADSSPLEGTAWILTSLSGHIPPTQFTATARFDGSRVQGTNGCNRYSAPVVVQGTNMEISPNKAATTTMACAPDIMKLADAFMTALGSARSYRIAGHKLDLLGADGTALARFSAQTQSLAGTAWHVTAINNGKDAVVSLVAGSSVTMKFATDGRVAGSGGCNSYTAGYAQNGGKLTFTAAAATRMMCAAAGVMEQEQAFLKALESAATARLEGNQLELRTADGALALSLVRDPGH